MKLLHHRDQPSQFLHLITFIKENKNPTAVVSQTDRFTSYSAKTLQVIPSSVKMVLSFRSAENKFHKFRNVYGSKYLPSVGIKSQLIRGY